jgi:hypothetical protein
MSTVLSAMTGDSKNGFLQVIPMAPERMGAANEGQYFIASTATTAAVTCNVTMLATFEPTRPLITMANSADVTLGVGKRCYLDFMRLRCTVAGVAGTATRISVAVDPATRYSSGGGTLATVNVNGDSSVTSGVTVKAGALLANAEGGSIRTIVADAVLRSVIPVVGDIYTVTFGGDSFPLGGMIAGSTAIAYAVENMPPVIAGPGQTIVINLWHPSQTTAAQWQVLLGWRER